MTALADLQTWLTHNVHAHEAEQINVLVSRILAEERTAVLQANKMLRGEWADSRDAEAFSLDLSKRLGELWGNP